MPIHEPRGGALSTEPEHAANTEPHKHPSFSSTLPHITPALWAVFAAVIAYDIICHDSLKSSEPGQGLDACTCTWREECVHTSTCIYIFFREWTDATCIPPHESGLVFVFIIFFLTRFGGQWAIKVIKLIRFIGRYTPWRTPFVFHFLVYISQRGKVRHGPRTTEQSGGAHGMQEVGVSIHHVGGLGTRATERDRDRDWTEQQDIHLCTRSIGPT